MSKTDKQVWGASYAEEYHGLAKCDTYKIITDEEYKTIRHKCKGILPTKPIATIKKDGEGNPIRAKYRIVVLGNLDPNPWSKQDCFAPVMSQLDLCLLVSIAIHLNIVPKSGDISQAFIQSMLPDNKPYVCWPPAGCPLTPPNSYWKLIKTLYCLKQSPRHWFNKAKTILEKIGLKQSPHSPCIFSDQILPNKPPLYLGLYVDDFIFFSQDLTVEKAFMQQFSSNVSCTFTKEINYFLGIKFTSDKDTKGNISITLTQQAYIENLLFQLNLHGDEINCPSTPYRSGYPIDNIPQKEYGEAQQQRLVKKCNF